MIRLIRKYKNRKLYDTTTSRYVSLKELLSICAEEDVKVEELSGRDVTGYTLAMAIAQMGDRVSLSSSVEILKAAVRSLLS